MPRRRRLPLAPLGLVAVLAVFGWGIVHLFQLRFAGGDVYPPYSTLRRDPLGTAVFYDALAALPDLRIERNLRPLASLARPAKLSLNRPASPSDAAHPGPGDADPLTCFYLGADANEWPFLFRHDAYVRLDEILRDGGRVVLTFLPSQTVLTEKRLDKLRRDQTDEDDPKSSPKPRQPLPRHSPPAAMRPEDLIERWSLDFRRFEKAAAPSPAKVDPHLQSTARPVAGGGLDGAGDVSWHTVLGFELETPEATRAGWRALYRDGKGHAVIVARPVGTRGGELILASDSYFLSNEALRAEARPALLAALVGPARRVVFDETHLGIAEQPGMMTLARRYGLQGGLAVLGLLAALFIWRNVSSLVPPPVPRTGSSAPSAGSIAGRDAAAGFLNLLRRGVPPRDLIAACFTRWQHAPGSREPAPALVEHLRTLAAGDDARRHPPPSTARCVPPCTAAPKRKPLTRIYLQSYTPAY